MKSIISSFLAVTIGLTPLSLALIEQPSWAQTQTQPQDLQQLLEQAVQQTQQGKPLEAIETFQQLLTIGRQQQDRELEALALLGLGLNYDRIGKSQQALDSCEQALVIYRDINDRSMEATTLYNLGHIYQSIGQPQKALEYYHQALPILREVGNRNIEAPTLNNLGHIYQSIGQPQKALEYLTGALVILREVEDRREEATTLSNIGSVYNSIGQPQKALEYLTKALLILREVGERKEEAATINNIGFVYYSIGQPYQALELYNQTLSIVREVGDRRGEATTLNNIGLVYDSIGQPQKALEFYNQALSIVREVGNRSLEASTLNNIGRIHDNIGQPQKALEYYNQALPILQQVGDRAKEAGTLNNIGLVYDSIGQPQKALEYYNQALPILQQVGDRSGEATTLSNIGSVYNTIGQPQKALSYYTEALPILQQVDNRTQQATTLNNIGVVYDNIGQPQKALEYYNQVLSLRQEIGDRTGEAITLSNIGFIYQRMEQPQKALEHYTQALRIHREVSDRSGEAITLNNIGIVYRSIGQPQKALEFYTQALSISREVGDRSGEATILGNMAIIYQDFNQPNEAITNLKESVTITLKIRGNLLKENRQQFFLVQPRTALALTNLLIEQNKPEEAYEWINLATTFELADYTRLINAKVSNPQAQQVIDQWNEKNQQLNSLRQQVQEDFSESLAQRMRELEAEVNKEAEEIVLRFSEVADLFETTPKDIAQLRESIPKGTTIIHPVLLTNNIAVFVITRDKLTVTKLPLDSTEFDNLITTTYEKLNNRFESEYLENLAQLYDLIIRPVESQLTPNQPISIIATGKLRYLPFETLFDSESDRYLIQKYSINYLTRLSTRQVSVNQNPTSNPKILAIGNPKSEGILALNGAEEEIKRITTILPESQSYIREKATLETFKIQSTQFTLLHLATHGCFNPKGCCLSSKCDKPDLEPNSILFADRSFNIADAATLGLKDVELITLSACQTALETNSNGQEISGVAYLFERAGAKAVIASLWSAEDETTRAIMEEFYQNIKSGMSQAEALQKAKLSQIESHPWYWSPFILIGNTN
ncbi:TPR repeat-containing protein [Gloeothece citriformis PCC 7424]|uniref:TPR repeat-containing protein n=1 Tax=Gloeothece citriformis (strain PCC 7424) TaxID=65393 RepID=B7KHB1_GLOC7|nr:CHAT domain-containing tetratricopeptide repeat protein [Gloeothece citriformis]ACK69320.1 TPR repeat-containing protein [Gloeothece citriformis PCC 7424]